MFYKKNTAEKLSDELFMNPTSEYRGTPFWAWNCKLDSNTLGKQIDILREMGFGGFHMHSRTGMATPYLQKEFMDLIKFCTDKAKKNEMLAYLYDEDRWPSGFAGGLVTKDPRFRQKQLIFTVTPREHFDKETAYTEGKPYLLGVYDIKLNSEGELECYSRIDEADVPVGAKWYAFLCTSPSDNPWYNNQCYVDTLDKDSIDEFINITYEAYNNSVGDEFGKTIPSIFTDEPQTIVKSPMSSAHGTEDSVFPWTTKLVDGFKNKYGYDICDKLPEIIWNLKDNEASVARYHYHDYIAELFTSSFSANCGKWCDEHGISLTGHILWEENLDLQTRAVGETMRSYPSFGIPGIDVLCNSVELTTAKQCQSSVHQCAKEAMLSELYGVTNWDFDFRGHKFQGDWQAALGVTVRVPHLSWVSMAGEAKRDYPASINYQSPWYKEYSYIENHFARLNTALTRGVPVVLLGVIHPIESYWLNYGPFENTGNIRAQLDEKFSNLIDWLLFGTIDFDFICESTLPQQLGGTNDGFKVGAMTYDAVLVPDCITLRRSTLEALDKFQKSGGKVIFAGSAPKYIDAVQSNDAKALCDKCVNVPYDRIAILDELQDIRTVEITDSANVRTKKFIYNMRKDNDCMWLFVARAKLFENDSPTFASISLNYEATASEEINIIINGECTPKLYNTLDGTICDIDYSRKNGKTIISREVFTSDSILLRLDNASAAPKAVCKETSLCKLDTIRFMEKVRFNRSEPNVLLLDRAEYALDGTDYQPQEEILKLDNNCRTKLGMPLRCESFAQPWVISEDKAEHFLNLRFTINSEIEYSGAQLAIEDAEVLEISFNGERVSNDICGYFTDKSIKTLPLPKINRGKNIMTVKLPFGRRTNVEWCYVLGNFGVKCEGAVSTIIADTDKLGFSDICTQGMPFYGGNIVYKAERSTPKCRAAIHTPFYRGALVKVYVDGKLAGINAFSPYKAEIDLSAGAHTFEFELFGTRINTFGGMHNVTRPIWVGPNFWRTEGDAWCYEYNLKPVGILASPIIELFESDK